MILSEAKFVARMKGSRIFVKNKLSPLFHKLPVLAVALCMMIFSLTACSQMSGIVSGVGAAGEFPVEVGGVTIGAKPQKVMVLSASLADVILALDCETQLVGGADECTQESLVDLTKVSATDSQAILDLAPDLVLADTLDSGVASALTEANITILTVTPATDREDFERLYAQVSSALLGGGAGYDAGVKCAQDIFMTLDNISRIVPQEKVTTACYLYDLDGSAVTGDTLASTIMSYAGVTNAFKSVTGGVYEFESLRVSNPDVIFCVPGLKAQMLADSRFANFNAVTNDRVVEMDPTLMTWQGRTVVETAYEISAAAYPELLEENSATISMPPEPTPSPTPVPEEDTTSYPDLAVGDNNEDVLAMQTRLDELGYLDTEYDGLYGETTSGCVRDFQENNGLEATGVADAATLRVLYSAGAVAKDGSTPGAASPVSSASSATE